MAKTGSIKHGSGSNIQSPVYPSMGSWDKMSKRSMARAKPGRGPKWQTKSRGSR